jgi:hypothetical protein
MTFIRRVEDFVCGHCGIEVKGNGFTNHCPECLWGKHVDIEPGDRLSKCQGMMEPVRIEGPVDALEIVHKCVACGYERPNKMAANDNMDTVMAIIKQHAAKA